MDDLVGQTINAAVHQSIERRLSAGFMSKLQAFHKVNFDDYAGSFPHGAPKVCLN
jgi:hypothetical protein